MEQKQTLTTKNNKLVLDSKRYVNFFGKHS